MAYQVGSVCYATQLEASAAACHAWPNTPTVLSNGDIRYMICDPANIYSNGDLTVNVYTLPAAGGTATMVAKRFPIFHQPCTYQDYVTAGTQIFVAVLTAWAGFYCVRWLYNYFNNYLHWSRGDE